MMVWAIELSEYDIQYEPRKAMKAQALAHELKWVGLSLIYLLILKRV